MMEDPWKHPAFAVAGIAAFVTADVTGPALAGTVNLSPSIGEYIAAGLAGIIFGFIIDDMVPAYLAQRKGASGGANDFGGSDIGGATDDFDLE